MDNSDETGVSNTEQYIIDESEEISLGETTDWVDKFFAAFPALHSRNFLLYCCGQIISMIGTWLQTVAQGWLVLQMTNSAFWVGITAAIGSIPLIIFTLLGGVIVDRFSKKHILYFTQTTAMILAIILGFLTITKQITLPEILTLAFILGITNAIDMPARQSFVAEMVGKDKLPSAIALNAGLFNISRILGPGIAGLLILKFGLGNVFLINGISFSAMIISMLFITVKHTAPTKKLQTLVAIKEGLTYSFTHPIIQVLLLFGTIASIFGWSYNTIMPVIVRDVFHQDTTVLGYFFGASGVGALLGSIILSATLKKINTPIAIFIGTVIFTISLFLFTFTHNIYLAYLALFFVGVGLIIQLSLLNTTLQHLAKDELRGRIMSIYTFMFIGLMPIGSIEIGSIAEHFGPGIAIRINATIVLLYGTYLFLKRHKITAKYESHKKHAITQNQISLNNRM
jgi:MFS family permease